MINDQIKHLLTDANENNGNMSIQKEKKKQKKTQKKNRKNKNKDNKNELAKQQLILCRNPFDSQLTAVT